MSVVLTARDVVLLRPPTPVCATFRPTIPPSTQAVEIIPDKYYFVWVKRPDSVRTSAIAANNITYCIDNELVRQRGGRTLRVYAASPTRPVAVRRRANASAASSVEGTMFQRIKSGACRGRSANRRRRQRHVVAAILTPAPHLRSPATSP